jgi:hypothetical protein
MANDVLSDEQIAINAFIRALAAKWLQGSLTILAHDALMDVKFAAVLLARELQQHRLAAVQAQPVSPTAATMPCPGFPDCFCGYPHDEDGASTKPVIARPDVAMVAAEMRGCLAGTNVQLIGQTMAAALAGWAERLTASVSPLRDETREPDTAELSEADRLKVEQIWNGFHEGDGMEPEIDRLCELVRQMREPDTAGRVDLEQLARETAETIHPCGMPYTDAIEYVSGVILAALQRARESAQGKPR